MMTQLFVNQSQVFIPLYLEEYLHIEAQRLPVLPLVMYISSSLTSVLTRSLNNNCGRRVSSIFLSIINTYNNFSNKFFYYFTARLLHRCTTSNYGLYSGIFWPACVLQIVHDLPGDRFIR